MSKLHNVSSGGLYALVWNYDLRRRRKILCTFLQTVAFCFFNFGNIAILWAALFTEGNKSFRWILNYFCFVVEVHFKGICQVATVIWKTFCKWIGKMGTRLKMLSWKDKSNEKYMAKHMSVFSSVEFSFHTLVSQSLQEWLKEIYG